MLGFKAPRNFFAHAIAALGGAIVLIELARHWLRAHEMEGGVIAIGCLFGFVGAYMADRKGALEGGGFVVNAFTDVVAVVRTGKRAGRRSTDAEMVDVVTDPPAAVPDLAKVPAPEKGT